MEGHDLSGYPLPPFLLSLALHIGFPVWLVGSPLSSRHLANLLGASQPLLLRAFQAIRTILEAGLCGALRFEITPQPVARAFLRRPDFDSVGDQQCGVRGGGVDIKRAAAIQPEQHGNHLPEFRSIAALEKVTGARQQRDCLTGCIAEAGDRIPVGVGRPRTRQQLDQLVSIFRQQVGDVVGKAQAGASFGG